MKPALLLLFANSFLHAQAGHWDGVLQPPTGEIPIQVDIDTDATGQFHGSITTPDIKGFPLSNIGSKGEEVFFQVRGTPGNRAFSGVLSSDGKRLNGEFRQGPFSLPFVLTRTGNARVTIVPKLTSVSKEMEGTWTAIANVSGQSVQLVLNLASQPDGSANGTIQTSADDLEIPISDFKQTESNVALELMAIGGTINAAVRGAELKGTFTQGTTTFPVSFQRK